MMEWGEYVSYLLSLGKDMEKLQISLDGGNTKTEVPPVVRASISMLDKMIEHQGKLNVIVFPERIQTVFIFTIMKLFHNISVGKIQTNYNPKEFLTGEKLKVGNAIVEYLGHEERNGKQYLCIRLADVNKASIPIEHSPVFQKVATNRRLSKWAKYVAERKKVVEPLNSDTAVGEKLAYVTDMKTHMDSSIYAMTSIVPIKEQLSQCVIDGKKVTSIFHIAHVDYEGTITNISPGQMSGIPAIVLASDLYAISAAAEEKHPIQSIIIDSSNMNMLMGQLDALDDLIELNVPIVCITDVANSFELDSFVARGFNVWRWDNDSLTEQLYNVISLSSDKRIQNCANQKITYLKTDGKEVSAAMKMLSFHRKETEVQSPQMMKLFEMLNSLTFNALRSTVPLTEAEIVNAKHMLSECNKIICVESQYLAEDSVADYKKVILALEAIYIKGYSLNKVESLKEYILDHPAEKMLLVIPERVSKTAVNQYWYSWCLQHRVKTRITVLYPSEYYSWPIGTADTTIICGWLKRAIMRKLIYSFNTANYVVLLYDYENRWKNHDAYRWSRALDNKNNKEIIEKSFSTENVSISTLRYVEKDIIQIPEETDELGEIELILRENKYKQYAKGSGFSSNETVSAVPVNFVGGFLAFYRVGHKVISATKIIMSEGDKIETKLPLELKVGDFVVVRETDKDLIREIADIILINSGKQGVREVATKWREALHIELLFCEEDDFCEKVKAAGCDKGNATIKRWIDDEDVIAPRSKEDLEILAAVTENETLKEMLDDIYDAAQEVRSAHVLAGRKLSEQLRLTLAAELKSFENIDPFNFWEPIDMEIDGIGNVKVLKIIDIGSEMQIDASDTNRLIEG